MVDVPLGATATDGGFFGQIPCRIAFEPVDEVSITLRKRSLKSSSNTGKLCKLQILSLS
jgi:hypothetical protein